MANETRNTLRPAKRKVRETVRRLEEARLDLLDAIGGLPLPASAHDQTELRTLSEVSELDALVRCAIHDHLDPLIGALRRVAQAQGKKPSRVTRSERRSHAVR